MPDLRYLRVPEPYRVELCAAPFEPLADDEVRLAARRSLISTGSELRRYRRYEGYGAFQYPVTDLGYSFVGDVVELGDAVEGVSLGDRFVAVQRHASHVTTRVGGDEARTAVRVPEGVSDEEATFGPLLRSSLNWLNNYDIQVGSTVVIVGAGLVGQLQLQAALLKSPRAVYVTDIYPLRLEIARRCGATEVIDASAGDPVAAVKGLTGGRGADVVVETVGGALVDSFLQALAMCRSGGRVVAVGMHTAPIPIPVHTLHNRQIVGSQIGYSLKAEVFERALELLAGGRFNVAPLITHRFGSEVAAAAYELLDQRPREALGVTLEW